MSKSFNKLVNEAVAIERELRAFNSPASLKLTAKAFLREALEIADTSNERLDLLEKSLQRPSMENAATSIRSCVSFIAHGYQGGSCNRPPTSARRLAFLFDDTSIAELAAVHSHPLEAFAFAVRQCGQAHPETFGQVEDLNALQKRLDHLKVKREELCKRIGKEYQPDDLTIGDLRSDGSAVITFTLSRGNISIAPLRDAGERLVNYLLTEQVEEVEAEAA